MSQVIRELQEKEADENGKVPSANEIFKNFPDTMSFLMMTRFQNQTLIFRILGIILRGYILDF